ncbi:calcium uniporter protein 2, mitochondrial-like [Senna tora]|uniref:Calcium uniporter protein 2, mitochondrial-like n=1 Tax=Senna tora TaxID=362788 RepID=A0A834SSP8_9FABA|nr:calcium uniporter protein 2, mitochondrial-like [Senna tora]
MAFRKSLAQRFLKFTKFSSQTLTNGRLSSSSVHSRIASSLSKPDIAPDPGDEGVFRRFLHKPSLFVPELRSSSPSLKDGLVDQLKAMDIARNRLRLDGLIPPPEKSDVTAEDARKLLKTAQLEMVKSRLREIRESCISYSELVRICAEHCSDQDQAKRMAEMLDDSAAVIVLGDIVFLRPEQVVKAIQNLLPLPGGKTYDTEAVRKELEELEKQKAAIDNKAVALVRRELWGGLGFFVLQTAAFMRLTFWELSWDVMEPICFFVTSMYFIAGYTFFLRTSIEPSFEGFYLSRFNTKQKRLMKGRKFDIQRYNELRAACFSPNSSSSPLASEFNSSIARPLNHSTNHHKFGL